MILPRYGIGKKHLIGDDVNLVTNTPCGHFGTSFTDNGNSGLFYAYDYSQEVSLVYTLHIYQTSQLPKEQTAVEVKILWSHDFRNAVLLIDRIPHAVYSFNEKVGYTDASQAEPNKKGDWRLHKMTASLRKRFFEEDCGWE